MTPRTRISDAELLAAVEDLVESGRTDAGDGGVHPATVAEVLDVQEINLYRRMRSHERLVRVTGLHPETAKPRWSFLPTSDADV